MATPETNANLGQLLILDIFNMYSKTQKNTFQKSRSLPTLNI